MYNGPPDPLLGMAPYENVRTTAQVMRVLFLTPLVLVNEIFVQKVIRAASLHQDFFVFPLHHSQSTCCSLQLAKHCK